MSADAATVPPVAPPTSPLGGVSVRPGPPSNDSPSMTSLAAQDPPDLKTEFDAIAPELVKGKPVLLAANVMQSKTRREPGIQCQVKPVRTRALLAIGRTLTGSIRPVNLYNMFAPIMEAETDSQQYAGVVAAFTQLLVTVPHSEREFIALLNVLVDPDPNDLKDKDDIERFWDYMSDPEPEDTIAVLSQMIANEKDRWQDLGKQLMTMFPRLRTQAAELEGVAPATS